MSLFEDSTYVWRETYFIFFDQKNRPSADKVQACLADLGAKYEPTGVKADEAGDIKFLTVKSPQDFSAMDIAYIEGEEVTTQIEEVTTEMRTQTLVGDEHEKMKAVQASTARFDVYHFEQANDGQADEFLDPGGLLIVLEKLASLCDGVAFDPQSHSLL